MIATMLAEIHVREGRLDVARERLDQVRSLTEPMPTYYYEPEVLRVEAQWHLRLGCQAEADRLLSVSIRRAQQHGSWALAVRSALELTEAHSSARNADVELLRSVYEHLPADNDTDYARKARTLLAIVHP